MTGPMTPGQRRALFAAGRARGLDRDTLRALTPAGSISALSADQARELLQRLNAGTEYAHPKVSECPRGPRRPKGVYAIATAAQRGKIDALRIDLGWTPEGLNSWLSERTHVDGRRMTRVDSTRDANAVIELLKAVVSRTRRLSPDAQAHELATMDQASPVPDTGGECEGASNIDRGSV